MFTQSLTPNLSLALLELSHAEDLFALTCANREYLREWLPWVDGVRSVEDTKVFVQTVQKQSCESGGFKTAIVFQGRVVGAIGFHRIDWANRLTSIGYWLGKQYQGQGIVTTSCRAYVDHAFAELKLNRVEIRCAVENRKSRAIPERLGFRLEGTVRDAQQLYDHFVDHVIYGMLAREWHKQATSA